MCMLKMIIFATCGDNNMNQVLFFYFYLSLIKSIFLNSLCSKVRRFEQLKVNCDRLFVCYGSFCNMRFFLGFFFFLYVNKAL